MSDETELDDKIVSKGLVAPRVTPQDLDNEIVDTQFHVFPGSCTTVCCITLRNGFTVIGESACASPENFDEDIGKDISERRARDHIWPLLGFRLRDALHLSD